MNPVLTHSPSQSSRLGRVGKLLLVVTLTASRDQLARDSRRITVPAEAAERLREAGLRKSAR